MGFVITPPRRRLSKEARRTQLIAAAEAVFAEVGYSGATMELIAAHDGVTRSPAACQYESAPAAATGNTNSSTRSETVTVSAAADPVTTTAVADRSSAVNA